MKFVIKKIGIIILIISVFILILSVSKKEDKAVYAMSSKVDDKIIIVDAGHRAEKMGELLVKMVLQKQIST